MAVLRHVAHEENLVLAIEFEVLSAAGRLNLNPNLTINPGQAPVIAKAIFDTFRTESLGDIKLAFSRGSLGLYGQIFRLDGAVFVHWIQSYLDEKYAEVERLQAKLKHEGKDNDSQIDYKAYIDRRKMEMEKAEDDRKREAEKRKREALYLMEKGEYKGPSPETLERYALENEWIVANHNSDGSKKEGWMDKESWMEAVKAPTTGEKN